MEHSRRGRVVVALVTTGVMAIATGGAAQAAPAEVAGSTGRAAAAADCTTQPQYTVVAREVSVRTQPGGSVSRGELPRGGKFNFRSSDSDHVWYYGYAEGIGFGFVLADGLRQTGTYQNCPEG